MVHCALVDKYQCYGGMCCFHVKIRKRGVAVCLKMSVSLMFLLLSYIMTVKTSVIIRVFAVSIFFFSVSEWCKSYLTCSATWTLDSNSVVA